MFKNKKLKKICSLVLSFIIVFGSFGTFVHAGNNYISSAKLELKEIAANKIMPEVLKDMDNENLVEVMIYLSDQVDGERIANDIKTNISSAKTPYQTKLEVRRGLVEALRDKAETTQLNMINYIEGEINNGNVEEYISYNIVNMIYVKATKEVIENISFMPEVEKIYKNKTYIQDIPQKENILIPSNNELEWNIERVRANEAWDLGFDGTGVVVANLDSGVDWKHPALKNKWRGYNSATGETNSEENWFDPFHGTELPVDSDQHGTHVMGTMVGQEEDGSNKIGVAPGAKWIAARVFNNAGSTTDAVLLSAADWILAPGGNPDAAPDVVNNSWGGGHGIDDFYREAVRNWRAAGIVPVFAAGNQRGGEPAPWPGSISVPSNYPESFAVAAIDRNDNRGSFSKLGPSPYDESLIKPDISGPGVNIRSAVPGGYEGGWNGTSMSSPAVSGAVALLLQADSSLTVDEIEEMLKSTADPLTDSTYPEAPNMGYGYGMVDTFESVSLVAAGTGVVAGRVLVPGEDLSAPIVEHKQETFHTYLGADIEIIAEISDDVSITEVELLIKAEGKSYWMQAPMKLIGGDYKKGTYSGTITSDMLTGDNIVYKIKVRDFAGEVVVTENYKIDITFGIIPDEYTQGFEEDASEWEFSGSWNWGIPSGDSPDAYEGEGLVGTNIDGFYPNNADDWLVTPAIDLRDQSLETASLRFYEWYEMENNYDVGFVLITNDYGENWEEVRPYITGSQTEWKEAMVNLEEYIGSENPVFVGFRLFSDRSGQRRGWYIDDIRLVGKDDQAPEVPTNLMAKASLKGIDLNWDLSPDADLSHYNVYRSEIPGEEYIKLSETIKNQFIDTQVVEGTRYYYRLNAEDTSGNISKFTEEVSAEGIEATVIYNSDFEEDNGGFTTGVTKGTNNSWEWGMPTSGPEEAFTGTNLWATNLSGDYDNDTNAYIESPPITIPEDKEGILVFNHWVDMEGSTTLWDYGMVEISKDDGETWTNITPASGRKYGTNVKEWEEQEVSLIAYTGETVKIRFMFYSDVSGTHSGWYVNDVSVLGVEYVAPEIPSREEIAYDNGIAEAAANMSDIGDGLAVRFTPAAFGKIESANIYLWDESFPDPGGNRLGFIIYDSNQQQVGETIYIDNLVRGDWNTIDLSSLNFQTADDFYISTMQDKSGAESPALGGDYHIDSEYIRSYYNYGGELEIISEAFGEWEIALMIRAVVDYENAEQTSNKVQLDPSMINLKSDKDLKKEDYLEITSPKYKLKENHINMENNYETLSDSEVQNMPMIFTGIPVRNAVITVLESGRSVKADPVTGKYFMRTAIGEHILRAEAYGYKSEDVVVNIEQDKIGKVNFVLDPKTKGRIEGQVVDRYNGAPAAYATIRLVEDPNIAPVTADENGNFTIEEVYEGEYTLKIISEGFESGQATATIVGDETTNILIELKRFIGYEDEISYDDGTAENAVLLNAPGHGLAVQFTPEKAGKVKGANVFFWGDDFPDPGGNRIGIAIYDADQKQVSNPIFLDIIRGEWNYIDLSDFGFSTGEDFYISTIQEAPGALNPAVGIDRGSPHTDRSYMNIDGEFRLIGSENIAGVVMIRAIMEYAIDTPIITSPGPLTYTNQDTVRVEGRSSADGKINVYVNDEKITSVETENREFTLEVDLPEIRNEIRVTAEIDGRETEPSEAVVVIKENSPPIRNIEPSEDVSLRAGDNLAISFNGLPGQEAYFRVLLPYENQSNNYGIPMDEIEPGFYSINWTIPENIIATDLLIEVLLVDAKENRISEIGPGKLTIIGDMENLASNSTIVGDESFDMDYLNKNSYAQRKLLEWSDLGKEIFLKLNSDTIVTIEGQMVTIDELPSRLTHFDGDGNITYYAK